MKNHDFLKGNGCGSVFFHTRGDVREFGKGVYRARLLDKVHTREKWSRFGVFSNIRRRSRTFCVDPSARLFAGLGLSAWILVRVFLATKI